MSATNLKERGLNNMASKLLDLGYYWVDVTYDDYFIYDVYQNELGDTKYIIVGTL